jgi:tRNA/rRNA methyltransferase
MGKSGRRANQAARVHLERVAIVLFRPRLPENIGAAARAACNMGLSRLVVVQPADLDAERMAMMATGAANCPSATPW